MIEFLAEVAAAIECDLFCTGAEASREAAGDDTAVLPEMAVWQHRGAIRRHLAADGITGGYGHEIYSAFVPVDPEVRLYTAYQGG
jgi:hypothetical protein